MINDNFNNNSRSQFWGERVLEADYIWAQVKTLLENNSLELTPTPRRPDVRLIVNNVSGVEFKFLNPGDHSNTAHEVIPYSGDKCAVMIMTCGNTMQQQYESAHYLDNRYDLGSKGITEEFVGDLIKGRLSGYIREAYGPAPFSAQASKLSLVEWKVSNNSMNIITPIIKDFSAYGARPAVAEKVFLTKFDIYVKGTETVGELIESDGICIAIGNSEQMETTRPIVPSVAREYYGEHFNHMPTVSVSPEGIVKYIKFSNGNVILNSNHVQNDSAISNAKPGYNR